MSFAEVKRFLTLPRVVPWFPWLGLTLTGTTCPRFNVLKVLVLLHTCQLSRFSRESPSFSSPGLLECLLGDFRGFFLRVVNGSTDRRINILARILDLERNFNGSAGSYDYSESRFYPVFGSGFWILVFRKFGSWISTFPRTSPALSLFYVSDVTRWRKWLEIVTHLSVTGPWCRDESCLLPA